MLFAKNATNEPITISRDELNKMKNWEQIIKIKTPSGCTRICDYSIISMGKDKKFIETNSYKKANHADSLSYDLINILKSAKVFLDLKFVCQPKYISRAYKIILKD